MDEINGSQLVLMVFFLKWYWIVMQDACVCVQVQSVQTLTLILYMQNSHFNRLELFMLFGMD